MPQDTIGQRLKFLMDSLNLKVRTFASALDVSETNIRNYISRDSKPSSDILKRIVQQYPAVNALWLINGQGEPFLTNPQSGITQTGNFNQAGNSNKQTIKDTKGGVQANSGGNNTINNVQLDNCQRDLAAATKEIELLRGQLTMAQALLEAKEETLSLLRAGHNRPN